MDVKPGYKQTEVGVIPEDWDVRPTCDIGNPVRGGSPRPAGDPRYFNGSYIPWLTVAALTNIPSSQLVVFRTDSCLTEEGSVHSRILTAGTLLIANSGATLGVAKILGIKCCANDGIAALLNLSKQICPYYLAHYINTKTAHLRDVVATGNGQPNLNTDLIGRFKIPLPPTKEEQEAIAGALGDADGLIESLEKLLAKQRGLKQAAMQQLLTGKKRLPGFSGEWKTKRLGDFVSIRNQKVLPSAVPPDTLCVELEHIEQASGRLLEASTAESTSATKYRFLPGDVLFGRLRSYLRKYWHADREGICSTEIWPLVVDQEQADGGYLHALVQTQQFIDAASIAYGTHMPRADWNVIRNFEVLTPDVKEQAAIASVLSDMDAAIGALEAKLGKARRIKQGMMQSLLTGRVRLVAPAGAGA